MSVTPRQIIWPRFSNFFDEKKKWVQVYQRYLGILEDFAALIYIPSRSLLIVKTKLTFFHTFA